MWVVKTVHVLNMLFYLKKEIPDLIIILSLNFLIVMLLCNVGGLVINLRVHVNEKK